MKDKIPLYRQLRLIGKAFFFLTAICFTVPGALQAGWVYYPGGACLFMFVLSSLVAVIQLKGLRAHEASKAAQETQTT